MVFELFNLLLSWILKWQIKLKFSSFNGIGDDGASKFGEGVSKLHNLTSLTLNLL